MKAGWRDLQKPTEPTKVLLRGHVLSVDQRAIDIWKEIPTAQFTIIFTEEMDGKFAALSTYDVPGL